MKYYYSKEGIAEVKRRLYSIGYEDCKEAQERIYEALNSWRLDLFLKMLDRGFIKTTEQGEMTIKEIQELSEFLYTAITNLNDDFY